MRELARDRTTIVMARRLQTARAADRVVVLERGRVAEIGTHGQLLDLDGGCARMGRAFATAGSHAS